MSIIKNHTLQYSDFPDFRPNLSPIQIFELGSFGGSYWRSIYSNITEKNYSKMHLDLPREWWRNIPNHWIRWQEYGCSKFKIYTNSK